MFPISDVLVAVPQDAAFSTDAAGLLKDIGGLVGLKEREMIFNMPMKVSARAGVSFHSSLIEMEIGSNFSKGGSPWLRYRPVGGSAKVRDAYVFLEMLQDYSSKEVLIRLLQDLVAARKEEVRLASQAFSAEVNQFLGSGNTAEYAWA